MLSRYIACQCLKPLTIVASSPASFTAAAACSVTSFVKLLSWPHMVPGDCLTTYSASKKPEKRECRSVTTNCNAHSQSWLHYAKHWMSMKSPAAICISQSAGDSMSFKRHMQACHTVAQCRMLACSIPRQRAHYEFLISLHMPHMPHAIASIHLRDYGSVKQCAYYGGSYGVRGCSEPVFACHCHDSVQSLQSLRRMSWGSQRQATDYDAYMCRTQLKCKQLLM